MLIYSWNIPILKIREFHEYINPVQLLGKSGYKLETWRIGK